MVRVTDPAKSREFYEALGVEFRRELRIVPDGHHDQGTTCSASRAKMPNWS
jgi:hypothetical protein